MEPERIFGEPYQAGDVTVIPVSSPCRGGGARALGVYAVSGQKVTWHPAVDDTRIALMGLLIGLVATTLGTLAMVRRPPWPDLSGTVHRSLR